MMKKITGIILAAGTGSRMGTAKQLLPFGATTLLGQVVQAAKASNLDHVIVVLGHAAEEIREKTDLSGIHIAVNRRYAEGQATSLITGLAAIDWHCSGAMFLLADQPLVDRQIINTLLEAWQASERQIMIPYCNGTRGNPVIIDAALFTALSEIKGDRGARALFDQYPEQIEKIEIHNPAILTDVDTEAAYHRLLKS
ncbi:MAG: nucleotidyltransferase family protein [Desulfobacteraceae bacterium]|jgi:molybdenum cofactor cytidylyltransferase